MQNQITADIEKFKIFIRTLIERVKLTFSKQAPVRILIIVGVIFILTVIFLIVGLIVGSMKKGGLVAPGKATPTPVSSAIPESSVSNPSKYATDSGILKIEETIRKLDSDLNSADLRESVLRPPVLDFDVKFD
ncbi:MAG: hypothetical protein AAB656_02640 [Patescibacteria group bacterium]|mgnify:CR=1 FL=1